MVRSLVIGTALALGMPAGAQAAVVQVRLEGTVGTIYDATASPSLGSPGALAADFGIQLGTPFEVLYTLDDGLVDSAPAGSGRAIYSDGSGVSGISVSIAGLHFDPVAPSNLQIWDGSFLPFLPDETAYDAWIFDNEVSLPDPAFSGYTVAQWNLWDADRTALTGDQLLPVPPDLAAWENNDFVVNSYGTVATCDPVPAEACDPSVPEYRTGRWEFRGPITSLTVVPEPGAGSLVATGLLGGVALRRGRRSSRRGFGGGLRLVS